MAIEVGVVCFFGVVVLWTCLPFIPAVNELLEPTDAEPVRVAADADVDIRHHARRFRESLHAKLAKAIARCRAEGRGQQGRLEDGTPYCVLVDNDQITAPQIPTTACKTMVVATGRLTLPARGVFLVEVYAEGTIRGGAGGIYRALLSDENIELERGCRSLRWIDAGGVVRAREDCRLLGRVSAGALIALGLGCRFERVRAARIELGTTAGARSGSTVDEPRADRVPLSPSTLSVPVEVAAGRWLVQGDLRVAAHRHIQADVVVLGTAHIGVGCRITGSIKAGQNLHLAERVVVEGSVVSARSVYIAAGCQVGGPVLAEGDIHVGTGSRMGSPDHLTTVSANKMWWAPGTVVYGTIWAHEGGIVGTATTATGGPR